MKVDLGSLEWTYNTPNETRKFFTSSNINSIVSKPQSNDALASAYCGAYMLRSSNDASDYYGNAYDDVIGIRSDGVICIRDTDYTDAASLKSALSGVYLYFDSVVQKARIPNEVKAEYGGVVSTDSEVLPDADISLKF
jgi:hypothetical protein